MYGQAKLSIAITNIINTLYLRELIKPQGAFISNAVKLLEQNRLPCYNQRIDFHFVRGFEQSERPV